MMIIFKLHGNDALEHLSLSQHNKDFWASTKLDQAEKKEREKKDSQKENWDSLLSLPEKRNERGELYEKQRHGGSTLC